MAPHPVVVASAHDDVRSQVQMTLAAERFDVVAVDTLDDAIVAVAARLPRVLVIDDRLADGGGARGLAARLRAQPDTAGVRTLLLVDREATPVADAAAGIDATVALPATSMTLLRRLEALLAD